MKSTFWFWFFAIIITLAAASYQRVSGPTYQKKVTYTLNQKDYKTKLPRSSNNDKDCKVDLNYIDSNFTAKLYHRPYPTNNDWVVTQFSPTEDGKISAYLPLQPAAGKLEYYIEFINKANNEAVFIAKEEPIVIRFKNPVPSWVLIPHVLIIFIAMLFSNLAGAFAFFKHSKYKYYGTLTLIFLLIGGFVLGPLMQKFAFGEYWTGFPFGFDLTDNKTLIALVAWVVAFFLNRKEDRPMVSFFAAIVMLIVFSIPHSLFGSELNHETGKVVTGFILQLF